LADFAGAWVFYSVLPGLPWVEPSFQRIARFAPWIGLTLGVIQGGFWLLLTFLGWPSIAVAPLLLAFGIWFSGGLHHDGLMDTADGLAAGRSRRLEAMEDSRVGASGVLALAMVLLIEMGALIQLGPPGTGGSASCRDRSSRCAALGDGSLRLSPSRRLCRIPP